jgi:hypothetical protein
MKTVHTHISLEGSSVSMQLNLPKSIFSFINVFKRLVQLSLLILVVNMIGYLTYRHFMEAAQEQRNYLYSKFQSINSQIDSLDAKIFKSYSNEDLLHLKFGLAVPDTGAREMGVGGSIFPDSTLVWSAMPLKKLKSNISDRFNGMEAKIDRSNNSYLNLQTYMELLHASLQRIPSVSPTVGVFSSAFGLRTHPVTGEFGKMHQGIDITGLKWTPIYATANGRVEKVSDSETLGKYVSIDHGNGMTTRYGHMVKPFAREGQMVSRFDVIGYIGNTGRTTGNHLHYEVWMNGVPMNPIYYMLPDQYSVE